MVKGNAMVSVHDLCLSAGRFRLRHISFSVGRGEYFILLGPTGCGKTLLAESICGLNVPDRGTVSIDDVDVTRADPARRKIGYVPQDYALLPFKTVQQNIAFGLEARRLGQKHIRNRSGEILDMLDIGHLKDRLPARLSGGERQRVALGRALAVKPKLLVLDEPLSALDENTSRALMDRLKMLHSQLDITFIHICHRLEEALTLGDRLALMCDGRIVQADTAQRMFSRPLNLFVAGFLRLPNVVRGAVRRAPDGNVFCINGVPVMRTELPEGGAYALMPLNDMCLSAARPGEEHGSVVFSARVAENRAGPFNPGLSLTGQIDLTVPGIFPEKEWPPGKEAFVRFRNSGIHVMPDNGSACT